MVQSGLQLKGEKLELRLQPPTTGELFWTLKNFAYLLPAPAFSKSLQVYLVRPVREAQMPLPHHSFAGRGPREMSADQHCLPGGERVSLSSSAPCLRLLPYMQWMVHRPRGLSADPWERVGGECWQTLWPGPLTVLISHSSSHTVHKIW